MAHTVKYPVLALRSNTGVEVWKANGPTAEYAQDGNFKRDDSKNCRAIVFSPDGRFLAWANGGTVLLYAVENWRLIATLPRPKVFFLKFSPLSNYLMTWELFTTSPTNPEGSPNLHIYKTLTGESVYSTVQKRQADWEPHWTSDEQLVALMLGGEVYFFEPNGPDGFEKAARKLGGGRNGGVSLSPSAGPNYWVGFYVPGVKGAPSSCKVYRYPNIDIAQPVAFKSFFQADKVEMIWNKRGNGMILLTSTDVDQTGVSYYGKQALHFINTKGDSFSVQLDADGPIHSVAWSPKSTDFCVVYGFMPAKATLFNLKCDRIFDFGTGTRNAIHYNAFGNLLLFGGFGNLRGNIEVWDMDKRKQISTSAAPDTTLLEWSPAGDIYFTATCAPRLRIGNGFKIWHYSGALLHETHWPDKQELWEVAWQSAPDGTWKEPIISATKVEGIQSSQAQASTQKYVPPCIRDNLTAKAVGKDEKYIPGLPPGYRSSTQTAKNGKRTNNQRRPNTRKEAEKTPLNGREDLETTSKPNGKPRPKTAPAGEGGSDAPKLSDKDPKIPKIHKKLREIRNLKEKQQKGEKLDTNQLAKLQTETELVQELSALKLAERQQKQQQQQPQAEQ